MFFNQLLNLRISNFCSIEMLELDVANQRLTHIVGVNNDDELSPSNGSGKSTIKSALCWNLFGMTETGRQADSILPWENPKNCFVISEWKAGNDILSIRRWRAHKEKKNSLELWLSGTNITGKDNDDTQRTIEAYLGFNYDLFCTLLTTGMTNKKLKDFMFMTDKEKKEYIGFLLDLTWLDSAQERIKESIKAINEKQSGIETERVKANSLMLDAQSKVEDYRERARVHAEVITKSIEQNELAQSDFTKQRTEKRTRLENLKAEIEKIVIPDAPDSTKVKETKRLYQAAQQHNQHLHEQNKTLSRDLMRFTETAQKPLSVDLNLPSIKRIQSEIDELNTQIIRLNGKSYDGPIYLEEFETKQIDLRSKQQANCNQITKLKNEKITDSDFCSNCGQSVTEEHRKHIQSENLKKIEFFEKDNENLKAELLELKKQHEIEIKKAYEAEKQKDSELLSDLRAKMAHSKARYDSIVEEETKALENCKAKTELSIAITRLKAEIDTNQALITTNQKNIDRWTIEIESLEAEVEALNHEILSKTQEKSSLKAQFAALKSEWDAAKAKIESLKAEHEKLTKDQAENPYAKFVIDLEQTIEQKNRELAEIDVQLVQISHELKHLQFWNEGFGDRGMKSFILDSVTELLSQKANFALSNIANGLSLDFNTQKRSKNDNLRDEFTVEIFKNEKAIQFVDLSKGERCRVAFAVNYALKSLGVYYHGLKLNFEWYDEVLDGLDEIGCYQVIQFLRRELTNYESIFVVSHNENVKGLFDRNLVIEKTNGKSVLKSE